MPVDATLSEALAPVLRDLENSGTLLPDILDEQERDFDGRVSAKFYGPDGSGMGVSAMAGEPLPERIASVADQVQEWATEAHWQAGWRPGPNARSTRALIRSRQCKAARRSRRVDLSQDRAADLRRRPVAQGLMALARLAACPISTVHPAGSRATFSTSWWRSSPGEVSAFSARGSSR
jgi:hypothetical protein